MAVYYVAKDGSDSNDGLSDVTPKLTIQAAWDAGGATTIHVGAGVYNEAVTCGGNSIYPVITSDGAYVVIDGLGVLPNGVTFGAFGNGSAILRGIIVRGFTSRLVWIKAPYFASSPATLDRCLLDGQGLGPIGVADDGATAAVTALSKTVITGCLVGYSVFNGGNPGGVSLERCVFYKNLTGFKSSAIAHAGRLNHLIKNTNFVVDGATSVAHEVSLDNTSEVDLNVLSDYNNYELLNGGKVSAASATLAAWRTQSGVDGQSLAVPSNYVLGNDGIYIPDISIPSGLINAGEPLGAGVAKTIGAYERGFGLTRLDTAWTSVTHLNTEFEPGTNRVRLASGQTSGTFTTATKTLSTPQIVSSKRLLLGLIEANVGSPNSIQTVDRLNTDQIRDIEFSINGGAFTPVSYGLLSEVDSVQSVFTIRLRLVLRTNGNI